MHESYLRWLHEQRQHERLASYRVYESYYNGDQEVSVPRKVRAALESELGTVSNYCRLVVDAAVDYILSGEVGIEVRQTGSPEEIRGTELSVPPAVAQAEALLYDVYDANGLLSEEMLKAATIMGKYGDAFLKLYIEDGDIKVRVLRPDIVFPRYRADDYREMLYSVVKWFEEGDEEENPPRPPFAKGGKEGWFAKGGKEGRYTEGGKEGRFTEEGRSGKGWRAQVFRPDVVEYYELGETTETEHSEWELVDVVPNVLGFIPIVHIRNGVDDLEFGVSDLQVMTDLQDALNKTTTDMLLTMDNQSFQRVFIFGGQTPKGHEISMEPGMITEVPNEEGKLQVVQAADIAPFIEAMREIVDQICTVTSIPKVAFTGPGGFPASGYALRVHYVPLERKCRKKELLLKNGFAKLNRMIFAAARLLGMGDYTAFRTTVQFAGGLPVDEKQRMEVQEMELKNRVKSRRTVMQERGIEDVDAEMAQIEAEISDQ